MSFGKVVVDEAVTIVIFVVAGFGLWAFGLHTDFVCSLALILAGFTLTKGAAARTKRAVLDAIAIIVKVVANFFGRAFSTHANNAAILAGVRTWAAFSNS